MRNSPLSLNRFKIPNINKWFEFCSHNSKIEILCDCMLTYLTHNVRIKLNQSRLSQKIKVRFSPPHILRSDFTWPICLTHISCRELAILCNYNFFFILFYWICFYYKLIDVRHVSTNFVRRSKYNEFGFRHIDRFTRMETTNHDKALIVLASHLKNKSLGT